MKRMAQALFVCLIGLFCFQFVQAQEVAEVDPPKTEKKNEQKPEEAQKISPEEKKTDSVPAKPSAGDPKTPTKKEEKKPVETKAPANDPKNTKKEDKPVEPKEAKRDLLPATSSFEEIERDAVSDAKDAIANPKYPKVHDSIRRLTPYRNYWRAHVEAYEKLINSTKELGTVLPKGHEWSQRHIRELQNQLHTAKERELSFQKILDELYKKQ